MQRLYGTKEHKPFAGGKDIIGRYITTLCIEPKFDFKANKKRTECLVSL